MFSTRAASVLRACLPGLLPRDELSLRRVQLPARRFGLGIRSKAKLAPAAFIGTLCQALPHMLDAADRNGVVQPGFMPQLAPLLGPGSFDKGSENTRFATLLASGSRLGNALQIHWSRLQAEMGAEPDGVLRPTAAGAGASLTQTQRLLTRQREGGPSTPSLGCGHTCTRRHGHAQARMAQCGQL